MTNTSDRDDGSPDDSVWGRMARELASNPDSPESLRIMSAISSAVAPLEAAVDQVKEAIATQMTDPGPAADAACDAAIGHWEKAAHGPMDQGLQLALRQEVREEITTARRGPPPVESILGSLGGRTDVGYDEGLHLQGVKGTWHRLWAMIGMANLFGGGEEHDRNVAELRGEFENVLGRSMSPTEWSALESDALAFEHPMASTYRAAK